MRKGVFSLRVLLPMNIAKKGVLNLGAFAGGFVLAFVLRSGMDQMKIAWDFDRE